jgi:L-amino acid N-acyltransferase YncA
MKNLKFEPLHEIDFVVVKEIYDYFIMHSTATFHTEPIAIKELKEFMYIDHPLYKSYLIYYEEAVAGYCYFSYFKKRQAYDRTAEVTLYLKPEFQNRGIGKATLHFLEEVAKKTIIKNLLAVITGSNFESIRLFEKSGYFKCAHFKNVGEKLGQILDVVIYQKEI